MVSSLQEGITQVRDLIGDAASNITNPFVSNPTAVAVGSAAAGVLVGAGTTLAITKIRTKRKKRKSKRSSTRKRSSKRSRGRRKPRTAGKGRDRSTKRIRYTKKGQPYVIKANGRAMFIKKSSAKRSHSLKGGRY